MHVKANERDYNLNKLLGTITCEECDIYNLFDPWRIPSKYKKAIAMDLGVQFQQQELHIEPTATSLAW